MLSKGLASTVQLDVGAHGTSLVDSWNRRTLTLSDTEARLINLWDGGTDAVLVARQAKEAGLDIDANQVTVFLLRLATAGFLMGVPLAPPPSEPSADLGPDAPTATVPRLRSDLEVTKPPGPGPACLVHVRDPQGNRTFTLYDFESSIARMLDGQRTADEVIQAANRIGIPVTLDSLRKFIRQLRAYGFIDEAATRSADQTTWAKRKAWDPQVRVLFQGALRLARAGRMEEAGTYLDALDEVDPGNEEASQLRAQIQAQVAAQIPVDLNFDEMHGEASLARPPSGALAMVRPTPAPAAPDLGADLVVPAPALLPDLVQPAAAELVAVAPGVAPAVPAPEPGPLALLPEPAMVGELPELAVPAALPEQIPVPLVETAVLEPLPQVAVPAMIPELAAAPIVEPALSPAGESSDSFEIPLDAPESTPPQPATTEAQPPASEAGDSIEVALEPPTPEPAPAAPVIESPMLPAPSPVEESARIPRPLTDPVLVMPRVGPAPEPAGGQPATAGQPSTAASSPALQRTSPPTPRRAPPPAAPEPTRSSISWVIWAGLALVVSLAAGGAYLMRPVPFHLHGTCTIETTTLAHVVSPRPGTIALAMVSSGAVVALGDELATLDTAVLRRDIDKLEGELADARSQAEALVLSASDAKKLAKLEAKVAKAQAAIAALEAKKAKAAARAHPKASTLASLETSLETKRAALAKLEAKRENLTQAEERQTSAQLARQLEGQLGGLKADLARSSIRAPVGGRFVTDNAVPGTGLSAGTEVGQILSTTGKVSATIDAPATTIPPIATVTLDSGQVPIRGLEIGPSAKGRQLTGVIDLSEVLEPKPTWPLELDLGTRHRYAELMHP